jgi:ComF family protein
MEGDGGFCCWNCRADFDVVRFPFCRVCGNPADGAIEREYTCSLCRARPPHYDRARSAVRLRRGLRHAVHRFKYGREPQLSRFLGPLLAACVRTHYSGIPFDMVSPVPLHAAKERERTYNQARLLAGALAVELGVGRPQAALRRVRRTATQTNLSAAERRRNVRNAFVPVHAAWLRGRTVLLVDDVMTTGATVDECSRVLKRAGAVGVYVVTVARG